MEYLDGGVCAPKGFLAAGIPSGIRSPGKKDLALIISETPAAAAAVFTKNIVKGAPILVSQKHLENGYARAIIANSGNANTCNDNGLEIAREMCSLVERFTGIPSSDVLVASTGVIGQRLSIEPIAMGIPSLLTVLGENSADAAEAIMTTDTVKKEVALRFTLGRNTVTLGGIAKGSGMIHPDMATMLAFVTTDAAISPPLLQKALNTAISDSFNMISVDRDTSTNDTVFVLANGMAENEQIVEEGADFEQFTAALSQLCLSLARKIAKDGEGATKLLECRVSGAKSKEAARLAAKSVVCSPLLKCAMFGEDANWGRVLCALGYSGADFDPGQAEVSFSSEFGSISVCRKGGGLDFSEENAKKILSASELIIEITLGENGESATAYGCDLSYDYVRINGDYRS